jgi:hypothetical protein
MYVKRPALFLGIGLILIPVTIVVTVLQWLLLQGLDAAGNLSGELGGVFAFLAVVVGTTLTLFGLGLVMATTAGALTEIDAGRSIGPVGAYRVMARRLRPLLGALALAVLVWVILTTTTFLIPVAVWLAVRWSLVAPVVALESLRPVAALRGSAQLVRGHWLKTGSLVGLSAALALAAGPLLGAILIFLTDTPLAVLNLVAGVVYAICMPFVALVASYVYFDARARTELEPVDRRSELPAEIQLSG